MAEAPTLRYLNPLTLGDAEGCPTGLQPRGTPVRGVGGGKESRDCGYFRELRQPEVRLRRIPLPQH